MRMSTKGGATPRDRRLDRRKVAIAAVAASSCSPRMLKANIVEFQVDQSQSSLKTDHQVGRSRFGWQQDRCCRNFRVRIRRRTTVACTSTFRTRPFSFCRVL